MYYSDMRGVDNFKIINLCYVKTCKTHPLFLYEKRYVDVFFSLEFG
jgi:hypothetical protein